MLASYAVQTYLAIVSDAAAVADTKPRAVAAGKLLYVFAELFRPVHHRRNIKRSCPQCRLKDRVPADQQRSVRINRPYTGENGADGG